MNWIGSWIYQLEAGPRDQVKQLRKQNYPATSFLAAQKSCLVQDALALNQLDTSDGTLTFPDISSSVSTTTTIRIHYENGDSTQRFANVVVNSVTHVVAFVPTTDGSTPGTSTLTVPLNSGSSNVISFEAYNGGWGK